MNTFNPLDDHYKKKFENWSVQPRADMWADIQKKMEEDNNEKPLPFWYNNRFGLILLGFIGIGLLSYAYINLNKNNQDKNLVIQTSNNLVPENPTVVSTVNTYSENENKNIIINNSSNKNALNIEKEENNSSKGENLTTFTEANTHSNKLIIKRKSNSNLNIINTSLKQKVVETNVNNEQLKTQNYKNNQKDFALLDNINSEETANQAVSIDNQITEVNTNDVTSKLISSLNKSQSYLQSKDYQLDMNQLPLARKFKFKTDKRCYGDETPDHSLKGEIYFNGGFTNNKFDSKDGDQTTFIQNREFSETGKMNIGYGGRLIYTYKRAFNLKAGIDYYQINSKFIHKNPGTRIITIIDTIQTDAGPKVITTTSYENGYNVSQVSNKYKFIDIPITLGYQKRFSNFLIQVNAGVSLNLTFIQEGKILNNLNSPISIDRFDPKKADVYKANAGISLIASLQLQMPISKTNYVFIEPNFRYVLNDVTTSGYQLSQKMSMVGSQIGIGFKL